MPRASALGIVAICADLADETLHHAEYVRDWLDILYARVGDDRADLFHQHDRTAPQHPDCLGPQSRPRPRGVSQLRENSVATYQLNWP